MTDTTSWCAQHRRKEPIYDDVFRVCMGCGHVYHSATLLVSKDLQVQLVMFGEFGQSTRPQPRPVEQITYCPLCLKSW